MPQNKTEQVDLIVTITNRGYADYVIDASKKAGAKGATIINGRGTSVHEQDVLFGINIQPEKEIILILTTRKNKVKIMNEICKSMDFNKKCKGLCFAMPVLETVGVSSLFNKTEIVENENKKNVKENNKIDKK